MWLLHLAEGIVHASIEFVTFFPEFNVFCENLLVAAALAVKAVHTFCHSRNYDENISTRILARYFIIAEIIIFIISVTVQ